MVSRIKQASNDTDTLAMNVDNNCKVCKDTGLFGEGLSKIYRQIRKISAIANRIGDTTLRKSNDFFELEMFLKGKAKDIEVPSYFTVEDNIISSTFSNLKLDKEDGKAINTDTLSNQNDDNVNFEFNKVLLNNITKNTGSKENKLREINGQSVNINNINNSNVQSQEVYDDSYKNMDRNISFDNINQNTNIRADNIEFNPNIRIIDLSPYENNEEPFWDDFYEQ